MQHIILTYLPQVLFLLDIIPVSIQKNESFTLPSLTSSSYLATPMFVFQLNIKPVSVLKYFENLFLPFLTSKEDCINSLKAEYLLPIQASPYKTVLIHNCPDKYYIKIS